MRLWALALCAALAGQMAVAQEVAEAEGAKLRILDRLSGVVRDVVLARGEATTVGRLNLRLDQCRYYPDNPGAEAFAHLTVADAQGGTPVFAGWMVASSPALSAIDHPRYDIWVLRCDVPDLELPEVEPAPEEGDQGATDAGNG